MKHSCTLMNCTLSLPIRHWNSGSNSSSQIRDARNTLSSPQVPEEAIPNVVHHLGRVNEILKLAGDTFSVMETLTPQDFMSFRDKTNASEWVSVFKSQRWNSFLA